MGYYPIFIELTERRCLVIGGGAVAERKVEELLAVGGRVTVISPTIAEGLRDLLAQGSIRHVERGYEWGDLVDWERVRRRHARSAKSWRITSQRTMRDSCKSPVKPAASCEKNLCP